MLNLPKPRWHERLSLFLWKYRMELEWIGMTVMAVIIGVLCVAVLSGCVATQGYTEERLQQADSLTVKRDKDVAQVTEDTLTGKRDPDEYAETVEKVLDKQPLPAPTPEQSEIPWTEITTGGITLLLAYFGINGSRDRRRRKLNEATNQEEAEKLGYYADIADRAKKEA